MTMETSGTGSTGFQDLIKRFWGFDHLIGSVLIKIVYYIGLVLILLFTVMGMLGGGLMGMMGLGEGGGGGAIMIILAPILGVVYLVFWRFICEMWLLMYLMYNRMGEIRDRLPPR
ncbi:DUF4282 domain-containing protein [Brevundimonas sp.]|uniref:DUF4282 domain-containing protein n=1 Tax=Brevundimonas sp. TaxID=1871086 RepID=UPI002D3C9138|nr:DUF4282 domain-containing protein [Brevundimonas sp.]HYC67987.1 DUF4282 domain-containing protein [Brevundimonas sp.]